MKVFACHAARIAHYPHLSQTTYTRQKPRLVRGNDGGATNPPFACETAWRKNVLREELDMAETLSLDTADRIAQATLAAARSAKLQPLTVVILDAGGHFILLKREDGCGFFRHNTAHAKAYGALGFGKGTRYFAEMYGRTPGMVSNLMAAVGGELFPSPGGVLIRDQAGVLLGAIGVSGDVGDRDEEVALVGLNAVNLRGDTGAGS
jgi:uncharacterized protein GlcG (DUF336 family)